MAQSGSIFDKNEMLWPIKDIYDNNVISPILGESVPSNINTPYGNKTPFLGVGAVSSEEAAQHLGVNPATMPTKLNSPIEFQQINGEAIKEIMYGPDPETFEIAARVNQIFDEQAQDIMTNYNDSPPVMTAENADNLFMSELLDTIDGATLQEDIQPLNVINSMLGDTGEQKNLALKNIEDFVTNDESYNQAILKNKPNTNVETINKVRDQYLNETAQVVGDDWKQQVLIQRENTIQSPEQITEKINTIQKTINNIQTVREIQKPVSLPNVNLFQNTAKTYPETYEKLAINDAKTISEFANTNNSDNTETNNIVNEIIKYVQQKEIVLPSNSNEVATPNIEQPQDVISNSPVIPKLPELPKIDLDSIATQADISPRIIKSYQNDVQKTTDNYSPTTSVEPVLSNMKQQSLMSEGMLQEQRENIAQSVVQSFGLEPENIKTQSTNLLKQVDSGIIDDIVRWSTPNANTIRPIKFQKSTDNIDETNEGFVLDEATATKRPTAKQKIIDTLMTNETAQNDYAQISGIQPETIQLWANNKIQENTNILGSSYIETAKQSDTYNNTPIKNNFSTRKNMEIFDKPAIPSNIQISRVQQEKPVLEIPEENNEPMISSEAIAKPDTLTNFQDIIKEPKQRWFDNVQPVIKQNSVTSPQKSLSISESTIVSEGPTFTPRQSQIIQSPNYNEREPISLFTASNLTKRYNKQKDNTDITLENSEKAANISRVNPDGDTPVIQNLQAPINTKMFQPASVTPSLETGLQLSQQREIEPDIHPSMTENRNTNTHTIVTSSGTVITGEAAREAIIKEQDTQNGLINDKYIEEKLNVNNENLTNLLSETISDVSNNISIKNISKACEGL